MKTKMWKEMVILPHHYLEILHQERKGQVKTIVTVFSSKSPDLLKSSMSISHHYIYIGVCMLKLFNEVMNYHS